MELGRILRALSLEMRTASGRMRGDAASIKNTFGPSAPSYFRTPKGSRCSLPGIPIDGVLLLGQRRRGGAGYRLGCRSVRVL